MLGMNRTFAFRFEAGTTSNHVLSFCSSSKHLAFRTLMRNGAGVRNMAGDSAEHTLSPATPRVGVHFCSISSYTDPCGFGVGQDSAGQRSPASLFALCASSSFSSSVAT